MAAVKSVNKHIQYKELARFGKQALTPDEINGCNQQEKERIPMNNAVVTSTAPNGMLRYAGSMQQRGQDT